MTALEAALVIARAHGSAASHIDQRLSRIGLGLNDVQRFGVISAHPTGATLQAMATDMNESPSQALRCVRQLQKLGWVTRAADGKFALTDSGADVLDQARGIGQSAAAGWFAEHNIEPAAVIKLLES